MSLSKPVADLNTFGIYGRDFSKDGQEPSAASSSSLNHIFGLMASVLVINQWDGIL